MMHACQEPSPVPLAPTPLRLDKRTESGMMSNGDVDDDNDDKINDVDEDRDED
jgi:hypothetical protein